MMEKNSLFKPERRPSMESGYRRPSKTAQQHLRKVNTPSAKSSAPNAKPRLSFKNLSTPSTPYQFTSSKLIGTSKKGGPFITMSESRVKKVSLPKSSASVEELHHVKSTCFAASVYDENYVWNPQKETSERPSPSKPTLHAEESNLCLSPAIEVDLDENLSADAHQVQLTTLQEDEGIFSTKTTTRPISRENVRNELKTAPKVELYGKMKLQSSMSSVTKFKARPNFTKSNMEQWKPKLQMQPSLKNTEIYKSLNSVKKGLKLTSTSPPPSRSLEASTEMKRRSNLSPAKPSIYKRLTSQKEMTYQSTPSGKKSMTTSKMSGVAGGKSPKQDLGLTALLTKPKVKAELYNLPRSKKNTLADIGILPKESGRRTATAKLITDSTLTQTTCEPTGSLRVPAGSEQLLPDRVPIDSFYTLVFGSELAKRDLTCSLWNSSADLLDPPNPHPLSFTFSPYSTSTPSPSSFLPPIPATWMASPRVAKMLDSLSRGLMDFYNRFPSGAPLQGRKVNLPAKKDSKSRFF